MRLRSDRERGEGQPRKTTTLHDIEAERALLGALLIDPRKVADIEGRLAADTFYDPLHRQIFGAMLAIPDRTAIDPITIKGKLSEAGVLDAATAERLRVIEESTLSAANVTHYVDIVADKALRRRLASVADEIGGLAVEAGSDTAALIDAAEKAVFEVTDQGRKGEPQLLKGVLKDTIELVKKMRSSKSAVTGMPTGIYQLDRRTTGFHPGELFILAARPGVGKTSLAMNMAVHAAARADPPRAVAVFNLEMPATQLALRMICSEARISQGKLKSGKLSDYDMGLIIQHAASLWEAPIYVDDSSSLSIMELRSKARRLKQQDPNLGFIVIDYLQLMSSRGKSESRQLEIAEISRGLKSLSKELSLPILALSQLSRDVEKNKRKPQLSDLRESGSIEQDADCVMFIHREPDAEPNGVGGPIPVELIIAKQRNGGIGGFDMVFMSEYTRFENAAEEGEGPPA
ncbi:replicative DNA helicase [Vulgatibacter incomptus]|uniref:Replicative DNA helicase n=1 Tax=Vulgatibacter incomptus TaxID=1391653 RepID=A0A0K1PET9_9BACT|nr:replicative DNA helicase [Vulgatibacter incomptus]AKU91931.1 Replicative DNA helicase [Vulgatibacter incomptus]